MLSDITQKKVLDFRHFGIKLFAIYSRQLFVTSDQLISSTFGLYIEVMGDGLELWNLDSTI